MALHYSSTCSDLLLCFFVHTTTVPLRSYSRNRSCACFSFHCHVLPNVSTRVLRHSELVYRHYVLGLNGHVPAPALEPLTTCWRAENCRNISYRALLSKMYIGFWYLRTGSMWHDLRVLRNRCYASMPHKIAHILDMLSCRMLTYGSTSPAHARFLSSFGNTATARLNARWEKFTLYFFSSAFYNRCAAKLEEDFGLQQASCDGHQVHLIVLSFSLVQPTWLLIAPEKLLWLVGCTHM